MSGMEGEVYFISDGEAIKIGFSGSAIVRMGDLQTSHHRPLKIMLTIPGTMDDERKMHQKFKHLRIAGEWFKPAPDLMAFIEAGGNPIDNDVQGKFVAAIEEAIISCMGENMHPAAMIATLKREAAWCEAAAKAGDEQVFWMHRR